MPKTVVTKSEISIKPLMGYVLIEPSSGEITTSFGIILPENSEEKLSQGTVLAVGSDIVLPNGMVLPCPVKVGAKVVFKKWGGENIVVKGIEYKLVKFDDLMATLEG